MKFNLKTTTKTVFSTLLITVCLAAFADIKEDTSQDKRISLNFDETEKAAFLNEMRQMLSSIQGIISGIGESNRQAIIDSARQSGNRMSRATPESIKKKTPQAFKELGGPTHMMFEELVIIAEDDDMETLAAFTGTLMKQCLACHAKFKTD